MRLADQQNSSKSPAKSKTKVQSKFKNETKPGVFTATKPLLDKDKDIVKKITKGLQLKRPVEVQTALLRRYFLELTQVLLFAMVYFSMAVMILSYILIENLGFFTL